LLEKNIEFAELLMRTIVGNFDQSSFFRRPTSAMSVLPGVSKTVVLDYYRPPKFLQLPDL
jgi:hypothetical protein